MIHHTLLEIFDWHSDDLNFVKDILTKSCIEMNATILKIAEHKFEPQGITIIILLAESHMSLHSFPEKNYCAIDCFTCGIMDPMIGINYLTQNFKSKIFKIKKIIRGI